MRQKIEISAEQAEKLKAAGLHIESRYYMYVDAIVESSRPTLTEKKKPRKAEKPYAPKGCIFELPKKQLKTGLISRLPPASRDYISCIVSYLATECPDGATREQLGKHLVEEFPRLKTGTNPIGSAKAYVSKAYKMGLIEVKIPC